MIGKKAPDPSYTERSVMIKRRKVVEKMTKENQKGEVAPKIWAEKGLSVCSRKHMGRAVCACAFTERAAIGIAGASSGSPKAKLPKEAGQFGSKLEARVELGSFVTNAPPSATRRSTARLKRWVKR